MGDNYGHGGGSNSGSYGNGGGGGGYANRQEYFDLRVRVSS